MDEFDGKVTGFKPELGQNDVRIPFTVDYHESKAVRQRNKWIWAVAGLIVIIAITIGLLLQQDKPFFEKIFVAFLFFSVTTLVLRFGYLGEHKIRDRMVQGIESKYKLPTRYLWGITKIEETAPYICTFPNNRQGIFVQMEKGVFKGDRKTARHRHREAIGDFYKLVGDMALSNTTLTVVHIDLMDYVGSDDRIDKARNSLSLDNNELVGRTVLSIYDHIKKQASKMVYTSDIFLFLWTGQSRVYLDKIHDGLDVLLSGGGYIGYTYMNSDDLRHMYRTLYNVDEFSVAKARRSAVVSAVDDIRPIMVTYYDGGVDKINYTREEERQLNTYNRQIKQDHKKAMAIRKTHDPDFKTAQLGTVKPRIMPKGYNGPIRQTHDDIGDSLDDDDMFVF